MAKREENPNKLKQLLKIEKSKPEISIGPNGSTLEVWTLPDGKLHREHGPAKICSDGLKEYWANGLLHREGGPSRITPGFEEYRHRGQIHRDDGPAVIHKDGRTEYYLDGKRIDEYSFLQILKGNYGKSY